MSYLTPLAERLRPNHWDDFIGQRHLFDEITGQLTLLLKQKKPASVVFWGPPGSGKTTLAKLYIKHFPFPSETIHSTSAQTADFKRVIQQAHAAPLVYRPTLLWVDEVHRLTRPQQDVLLPCLEDGSIVLIAATTENPSFQLSRALLSRIQVLILESLDQKNLEQLLDQIERKSKKLPLTVDARSLLCQWANGDARSLLNWVELLGQEDAAKELEIKDLEKLLQKKAYGIDHTGEGRYQMISALHKSVRASNCNAALYWLVRMLVAGEDPLYIARRIIRMASEDIGLADPQALEIALHAYEAYEKLGSPEGDLALAQVVIYFSLAPKSNALYVAFNEAKKEAEASHHLPVPKNIVNAATSWMQEVGFGKDYIYEHDLKDAYSGQNCFPEKLGARSYYKPMERGFERELNKRLAYFCKLQSQMQSVK